MENWLSYLKKTKFRKRILIGFALVALISGGVGIISIRNLDKLQNTNTDLYNNITVSLSQYTELATDFQQIQVLIRDAYMAENTMVAGKILAKLEDLNKHFNSTVAILKPKVFDETDSSNCSAINKAHIVYVAYLPKFKSAILNNQRDIAHKLIYEDWLIANEKLQKAIDTAIQYNIETGRDFSDNNTLLLESTTLSMIVLIVLGIISAITLGFISNSNNRKKESKKDRERFIKTYWHYVFQGDNQNAEKALTEGLKYCGNDIELYFLRANCRFDLKNYKDALYDFNTAIMLDKTKEFKNLPDAFYSRGAIKYMNGDKTNALIDFNIAQEMTDHKLENYNDYCRN